MSDKELLEAAAKAAGITVSRIRLDDPMHVDFLIENSTRNVWQKAGPWNPLTDDGDALRLLVALPSLWALKKMFGGPTVQVDVAWGTGRGIVEAEFFGEGSDRCAAARRAIVRAAAEIGRRYD